MGYGAEESLERGFICPVYQNVVFLGSSVTCGVGLLSLSSRRLAQSLETPTVTTSSLSLISEQGCRSGTSSGVCRDVIGFSSGYCTCQGSQRHQLHLPSSRLWCHLSVAALPTPAMWRVCLAVGEPGFAGSSTAQWSLGCFSGQLGDGVALL